jgi:hypothetical protein
MYTFKIIMTPKFFATTRGGNGSSELDRGSSSTDEPRKLPMQVLKEITIKQI